MHLPVRDAHNTVTRCSNRLFVPLCPGYESMWNKKQPCGDAIVPHRHKNAYMCDKTHRREAENCSTCWLDCRKLKQTTKISAIKAGTGITFFFLSRDVPHIVWCFFLKRAVTGSMRGKIRLRLALKYTRPQNTVQNDRRASKNVPRVTKVTQELKKRASRSSAIA